MGRNLLYPQSPIEERGNRLLPVFCLGWKVHRFRKQWLYIIHLKCIIIYRERLGFDRSLKIPNNPLSPFKLPPQPKSYPHHHLWSPISTSSNTTIAGRSPTHCCCKLSRGRPRPRPRRRASVSFSRAWRHTAAALTVGRAGGAPELLVYNAATRATRSVRLRSLDYRCVRARVSQHHTHAHTLTLL